MVISPTFALNAAFSNWYTICKEVKYPKSPLLSAAEGSSEVFFAAAANLSVAEFNEDVKPLTAFNLEL